MQGDFCRRRQSSLRSLILSDVPDCRRSGLRALSQIRVRFYRLVSRRARPAETPAALHVARRPQVTASIFVATSAVAPSGTSGTGDRCVGKSEGIQISLFVIVSRHSYSIHEKSEVNGSLACMSFVSIFKSYFGEERFPNRRCFALRFGRRIELGVSNGVSPSAWIGCL